MGRRKYFFEGIRQVFLSIDELGFNGTKIHQ